MEPPLLLCVCVCKATGDSRNIPRCFAIGERSYIVVGQRAVVDAQLVDVSAAVLAVGAFDAGGADDAGVRPKLIQSGIEHTRSGLFGHHLAVHVKADAGRCEDDSICI